MKSHYLTEEQERQQREAHARFWAALRPRWTPEELERIANLAADLLTAVDGMQFFGSQDGAQKLIDARNALAAMIRNKERS